MPALLPWLVMLCLARTPESSASRLPNPNVVRLAVASRTLRDSDAIFYGQDLVPSLQRRLAALPRSADKKIFQTKLQLGDGYLRVGRIADAITSFTEALAMARRLGARDGAEVALRWLAVANMRAGELDNCVAHRGMDTCIFPLGADAIYTRRQASTSALECLNQALALDPGDRTAVWLLNLVHMTLGTYPGDVPAPFLIQPAAFASEYDLPRFHDVAPKVGLNRFGTLGGAVMDDFDGDGYLDVMLSALDPSKGVELYHNDGDGRFTNVSTRAGLDDQVAGFNLVQADVDNDGRLDVLVLRGGWLREWGELPNSLLLQDADGRFEDVTESAGIGVSAPTQVGAFADIDNDGDLDVFIGYESMTVAGEVKYPSHLYSNLGNARFEDITALAGTANERMCKGAAFGDYDEDGLPDLYVSNHLAENRLYHNDGNGRFSDRAPQLGVTHPIDGFACWFFDANDDGHLDLYACYYGAPFRSAQLVDYYRNGKIGEDTSRLYENDGHGGFRDVTEQRGLRRVNFAMGCNFGDLDNDGYADIYLGTGDPDYSSLWPNIMLRNDRGRRFQDVTAAGGFGLLQKGHAVAWGDLDNDGDQDIFIEMGGAYENDAFWSVLFENPGNANHWLTVKLIGVRSNRCAIGARIGVHVVDVDGSKRVVHAWVSSGSSFGGNSLQQEIGLGAAHHIERLDVVWPTTRQTQSFTDVPLDRYLVIEEGAPSFRIDVRKPITLAH